MKPRDELQKRIERKQQEILELEMQIREAKAYIQALQETVKMLPKDSEPLNPDQVLRPGSGVAKARNVIKATGKPLHISEILKALGLPVDKKHRVSLGGSLSGYARRNEIFTRPLPNTFGLIEFKNAPQGPPNDFGSLEVEIDETDDIKL